MGRFPESWGLRANVSFSSHRFPFLPSIFSEQQEQARKLLYEEADTFAASDYDVGCIPGLLNNYSMSIRWI